MSPFVVKTLKHLGLLALFSAGVAVVAAVIVLIGGINVATLPAGYALLAGAVVPLVIGALKNAQAELAADLAREQAATSAAEAATATHQATLATTKLNALMAQAPKATKSSKA
jgi:hypothetical protein